MKKFKLLIILSIIACALHGNDYDYKFRLSLKDKGPAIYSLKYPEEFLSEKAIERRRKFNIPIDSTDIPISRLYIDQIQDIGGIVVAKSKWLRTVSVHCTDSSMVESLKKLPFVTSAKFVWKGKKGEVSKINYKQYDDSLLMNATYKSYPEKSRAIEMADNLYGPSIINATLQNGVALHSAGYKGKGIDIAVIDAGFNNMHKILYFDNINIVDHRGFVYQGGSIFEKTSQHGLNVLSCMALNKPNYYIGTAPEANYILLASEDSRSEFPIEEDYWTAAIEYADSIGVDLVNTSLGYVDFDKPADSRHKKDLNGRTAFISRAANMAVDKGLFIVCSAGNSGNSEWRTLTPPGDAIGVLTVGAVAKDSMIASFSSRGFTSDFRVKPDVVALGRGALVIEDNGAASLKNGTSFSAPIICGMVACLWQAFPNLTNAQLLAIFQQSSDKYRIPDQSYGYGLPDMKKALQMADDMTNGNKKLVGANY